MNLADFRIEAAKLSGNGERAVMRIDKNDNSIVLLFPDDDANLGYIAALGYDCGGWHYAQVSFEWMRTGTLAVRTWENNKRYTDYSYADLKSSLVSVLAYLADITAYDLPRLMEK